MWTMSFSRGIEIQQIVSPEVRRQALKIVYESVSHGYAESGTVGSGA